MKGIYLFLICVIGIHSMSAQEQEKDLYIGWNHLLTIGTDLSQLVKINPRIGEEGSSIRWGGSLEMKNILVDQFYEFRNRIELQLGGFRNETDQFIDTSTQALLNPFRKNYDRVEWQLLFSREIVPERDYITAEQYAISQLTPSFDGNYFNRALPELRKLSGFLSPVISTTSVGLERRKSSIYSIYVSPAALKVLHVKNDEVASIPALNSIGDSIEFFGTGIHGNELDFNVETLEVLSYEKTKTFFGAQLLFRYQNEIIKDKLEFENETRLFLDYLNTPLQLDIQLNAQINFMLLKGLQIGFIADIIRDNNLIFQSADPARTNQIARSIFTKGTSYMHRLMLRYTFEK